MRLRTREFVLRAISVSDWAVEAELSRDAEVVQWTFYPQDMDEQAARDRIHRYQKRAAELAVRRFVITDEQGNPLGTCGIGRLQEATPEVFYALLRRGRGRGAATQAVVSLADWAFATGRQSVALLTIDGNRPSERVALRAGFVAVEQFEDDHRGRAVSITRWLLQRTAS
jgi:RimJ/RimL family protein N-acetyltransferase